MSSRARSSVPRLLTRDALTGTGAVEAAPRCALVRARGRRRGPRRPLLSSPTCALVLTLCVGCTRAATSADVGMEAFSELQVEGERLSLEAQRTIRDEIRRAVAVECEVYDKPDLELQEIPGNSNETRIWSLFYARGWIYPGLYLDAWTTRMQGQKSTCYTLSQKLRDALEARERVE